jgi:D-alanyl-D-alanine carboxypeptidase/D-alanyl-D-alanine-endopeptidase (penicillin-binding protein 4)
MKKITSQHYQHIYFIIVIILILNGCIPSKKVSDKSFRTSAHSLPELRAGIDSWFSDSLFANAHWGVLIQSLKTGEVWYERNADRLFNPASNTKIPTSASTLSKLGADFTYKTLLKYRGEIKDSVLQGDLIVFGDGDPSLNPRFFSDSRELFRSWADSLKKRGIKHITGNIIGDDNAFDDESFGSGWTLDNLGEYYSAEIGALQLNENYVEFNISANHQTNGKAKITANPDSKYYNVENEISIVDTGKTTVNFLREKCANNITLYGYLNYTDTSKTTLPVAIINPTLFYVTVLSETFRQMGIKIDGKPIDCDDVTGWAFTPNDFKQVALHLSPPLATILAEMLKKSQNLYAETFIKTLGYKFTGKGSFASGKKIVDSVLTSFGIRTNTYAYVDGSGLSRYNYFSPRQFVKILTGMYRSPLHDVWYASLPIAGVDGTLKSRMKNPPVLGNVHAKTGTISNVRGLSGYVTTASGEPLVFSFLVNGHLCTTSDTNLITDSVLQLIAGFKN